jgi:hypothetical protein
MNYTKEQIERIKEELNIITEHELEDSYRTILDDIYTSVNICGYEYSPSDALASTDPIAFRCGFADYLGTEERLIEIDGNYYNTEEVDDLIDKMEDEKFDEKEKEEI